MPTYPNLPGTQVLTIDGGLAAKKVPSTKSTLIIGTSGQGPANEPYQVLDRSTAASVFGLSGSLIRSMEEVAIGGNDNIILFRAGTTPAKLGGVGHDVTSGATTPGFDITFSEVATNTSTRYLIWYKSGILYVWLDGQLVYANDPTNNNVIDAGNISLSATATGNAGLQFGTGSTATFNAAITIAAAAALAGSSNTPAPTLTAAITGTALTGRQTYIAIAKALDLLSVYPVDQLYVGDAKLDQPNVAFYVSSNSTTVANNPATNPDALDWLKITTDGFGNKVYQWASEVLDSNGGTVTAMTASTAAARATAGFGETNYPTLLGNFCYVQENVGLAGTCICFMGINAPKSYSLVDTRSWIGFLPTYDLVITNKALVAGKGILGNPLLSGIPATGLNLLCADYAAGYRTSGIFLTNNGLYDGTIQTDTNGNPIDLGAYIHVVGDYAILSNGFATNYVTNLAGLVAGYHSTLDPKIALTNKSLNVIQLWKPNNAQMDSLTLVGVNVLRFKGPNALAALLHGETIANPNSDYINLLRQDIKGLVVNTVRQVADTFIGFANTDLLSLEGLKTALGNKFLALQKRGYLTSYSFTVLTTNADIRLGHASIYVNFVPVNELVQLQVQVGITQTNS